MVHLAYLSLSLSNLQLTFFVPPFSYALNCKRKFLRVRILVPMTKKTTCCIHVRAQKKAHGSILIIIITIHERKEMYRLFSMNDVSWNTHFCFRQQVIQIKLNFCDCQLNGKYIPWFKNIVNNYTILTSSKVIFMLINISANIKPGKFRLRKPWFKAGISMRKYIYLKPSFPLSFHRLCRKIWVKNLT